MSSDLRLIIITTLKLCFISISRAHGKQTSVGSYENISFALITAKKQLIFGLKYDSFCAIHSIFPDNNQKYDKYQSSCQWFFVHPPNVSSCHLSSACLQFVLIESPPRTKVYRIYLWLNGLMIDCVVIEDTRWVITSDFIFQFSRVLD